MLQRHVTEQAQERLLAQGYREVTLRGAPGTRKTAKVATRFPRHTAILVEEGTDFERWLIRRQTKEV